MPMANPASVTTCPCSHSGTGNDMPLLERKMPGSGCSASDAGGSQSPFSSEVPHQQLYQDRDVPEQLDVAGAQAAHQEVARQPADADQRAENRRQHDADKRRAQRVGQADQERLPVGIGRVERERGLADVESGGLREEAEPALDSAHAHVLQRVVREEPDGGGDHRHRHTLVNQTACCPAAPGPVASLGPHSLKAGGFSESAARTGCRPCSTGC